MKKSTLIITLFTLALFTFSGVAFADADRFASKVVVSNVNVEADGDKKVYIKIYLRDKSNNPEKDTVFISTDRGSVDQFWIKDGSKWKRVSKNSDADVYYIDTGVVKAKIDKYLELGMSSTVKGKPKIGVSLKDDEGRSVWKYVSGHATEAEAEIIKVQYKDNDDQKVTENPDYKTLTINLTGPVENHTNNELELEILDKDDKAMKVGDEIQSLDLKYEILNKPDGAKAKLEKDGKWEEKLRDAGKTPIIFSTDKPGQYELEYTLNFKYPKSSFNQNFSLTNTIILNVQEKQFGAESITMYINDKQAVVDGKATPMQIAPFIHENRTFVPVRFLAEALGAEVEWQEEAQAIILTRPDKKITMVIGNNALVLSTGGAVLSDVPPFIKDGFTVLPFRAIAEAFGAQVEAILDNTGHVNRVIFLNK